VATKTIYFLWDTDVGAGQALGSLQDGGSAPTLATATSGWTVGKVAPTVYADYQVNTKVTSGTFGNAQALPNSVAPSGSGNALRSQAQMSGSFAAGNWDFSILVRAVGAGGAQDGRIRFRLFKTSVSNASSLTEVGGGVLIGATVTNLATTADQTTNVTTALAQIDLSNEWLVVKAAWEITGAGGSNTADVLLRLGSSSRIITPDFTPSGATFVPTDPMGMAGFFGA